MDIFETGHTRLRRTLRNILPVIIPAGLCLIFYLGISCAGRGAYALTGHYPLSLEELLHDYNISYDTDKFVVEYVPSGSNLLPSISVLVLSSGKGGSL